MKKLLTAIAFIFSLSAFAQTAKDYYVEGSKLYLESKFKEASEAYSKALDLEKKKRTFDKENYYVLLDNLAIAYGISGNLDDAIKTLEYGVSIDSAYPMFYYNLACSYAEKGDIDKTVKYLELALKYRKNMLKGEEFPNPNEDDSFKPFLTNDKFKKAAQKY